MEQLINIITIPGVVIGLIILNQFGILDKILPKKNGNGISKKLNEIESNHLEHIENRLSEICDKLDKIHDVSMEMNLIIKERLK